MTATLEQLALVTGGRLELGSGCQAEQMIADQVTLAGNAGDPTTIRWSIGGEQSLRPQAWAARSGLVTESQPRYVPAGCWALVVDDARRALYAWARHRRDLHGDAVIATIGDHEPLALRSLLATALRVAPPAPTAHAADLEMCLGLAALSPQRKVAVVSTPAVDSPRLLRIAQPDIAVCLSEGEGRYAALAAPESLARRRQSLAALPEHTLTILPGDEPLSRRAAAEAPGRVLFVGRGGDCDLVADRVACRSGKLTFRVAGQDFELSTWGRQRLTPALAAIAVARELGQSLAAAATALREWEDTISPTVSEPTGVLTIGPVQTSEYRMALAMLREFPASGRRVVVCGQDDWAAAPRWRRRMGQLAVQDCGADLLLAYGDHSDEVARGARRAGLPADRAVVCHDLDEARRFAAKALQPGDTVLLHGPDAGWRSEAPTDHAARRAA